MSDSGSFSDKIKDEICAQPPKRQCCRRAFILGAILGSRRDKNGVIRMRAGKNARNELLQKLIKEQLGREACVKARGGDSTRFTLYFQLPASLAGNPPGENDYKALLKCPECSQSLFGGIFLAAGSVNKPDGEYYLQFSFQDTESRALAALLFGEAGMPMACAVRRDKLVLYTRASVVIEDFLALIRSPKAYFELVNAKIIKDIRNDANRRANCDSGNITKSVGAAQKVMAAIKKLEASGRLQSLPAELEEAAKLRTENPHASIERLGLLANPTVTKSGMNHRLSKIMKIAHELK